VQHSRNCVSRGFHSNSDGTDAADGSLHVLPVLKVLELSEYPTSLASLARASPNLTRLTVTDSYPWTYYSIPEGDSVDDTCWTKLTYVCIDAKSWKSQDVPKRELVQLTLLGQWDEIQLDTVTPGNVMQLQKLVILNLATSAPTLTGIVDSSLEGIRVLVSDMALPQIRNSEEVDIVLDHFVSPLSTYANFDRRSLTRFVSG
jgi:hypothetical protein